MNDVYDQLRVKKYINGLATVTSMGGSIMPAQVVDAMNEASKSFVSIVELQQRAGEQIARWTNNEAAMVSNGAASGMLLASAVCLTGVDPEKKNKLPFIDDGINEILVYGYDRCGYEFPLRQAGGKIVVYGSAAGAAEQELEEAITPRTVALFVFYFEHRMSRQLHLSKVAEIAHRHGVPVIVDAAAQLPARENLWRFTRDWGADLAIFSGGKGLCGPQSSGLVVGKKELIDRMISFACPNGGIGRVMKVGKEEIIGLMTAVRLYMEKDMATEMSVWEEQVQWAVGALSNERALTAVRDFPSEAGQPMPRVKISFTDATAAMNPRMLADQLKNGEPGILVAATDEAVLINPQTMKPGDMQIIIKRIKELIAISR